MPFKYESEPEGNVYFKPGYRHFFESTKDAPLRGMHPLIRWARDWQKFMRWDGVRGTAKEHLDWMYEHTKEFCDLNNVAGFVSVGSTKGIKFEKHEELSNQGDGYGYFRLSGEIDISPEMLCAIALNVETLGKLDKTVRHLHLVQKFDSQNRLCFWTASPGLPFNLQDGFDLLNLMPCSWRDGLDFTGWRKDDEGNFYQVSVSVHSTEYPQLQPQRGTFLWTPTSIRAIDRYWGYKLTPLENGKTKLVLVCQTILNGWIPKFPVNLMICRVLTYYIRDIEEEGKRIAQAGQEQQFVSRVLDV